MKNTTLPAALLWLAACLGGHIAAQEPGAADRPDLKLLDRFERPLAVGVLEIGEHFRGPEAANLEMISSAHPMMLTSEPLAAAKKAGLLPENVERVVLTLGESTAAIVTTSDPATLAKLRNLVFPEGREEAVGDRKVLVEGLLGTAGFEPTDRELVLASRQTLEAMGKPSVVGPSRIVREFQTSAGSKPLLALLVDASVVGQLLKKNVGDHSLAPLFEAQTWSFVCKKTAKGFQIALSAQFDDGAKAETAVRSSKELQNIVVSFLNVAAVQFPEMLEKQTKDHPDGGKIAPLLGSSLKRIGTAFGKNPPQLKGNTITVGCEVETETPAADVLFLVNLLPRGAKEPARP